MRIFMFLLAVALMTGGTLIVRASAENIQDQNTQQIHQDKDVPEAAKRHHKLYA